MRLLITRVSTTLQGASLDIMTALLAAMRVFAQNGLNELRVTRYYKFTNMNDPKRRQHERLELETDNTAHARLLADHIQEQVNEFAYVEHTGNSLTIITAKPT